MSADGESAAVRRSLLSSTAAAARDSGRASALSARSDAGVSCGEGARMESRWSAEGSMDGEARPREKA
jgi:hypothetical protein